MVLTERLSGLKREKPRRLHGSSTGKPGHLSEKLGESWEKLGESMEKLGQSWEKLGEIVKNDEVEQTLVGARNSVVLARMLLGTLKDLNLRQLS